MMKRTVVTIFLAASILALSACGSSAKKADSSTASADSQTSTQSGVETPAPTPMPTAAVPDMMKAGGYSQKDLLKGGWLFSVLSCAVCVLWIMSVFPVK